MYVCYVAIVTDPITEAQLEPLIHLLLSSDLEVQKASSLAISNLALHGPGTPLYYSVLLVYKVAFIERWASYRVAFIERWPSYRVAFIERWPSYRVAFIERWPSYRVAFIERWPSYRVAFIERWPSYRVSFIESDIWAIYIPILSVQCVCDFPSFTPHSFE